MEKMVADDAKKEANKANKDKWPETW